MNTNKRQSDLSKRDEIAFEQAAISMTDSAKLEKMGEDILPGRIPYRDGVVRHLCRNQNLSFQMAEKLAPLDSLSELYCRPDASPQALHALAETTESLYMIGIIAGHANTTQATLINLTKHPNPRAVYLALTTGRLPAPMVEGFANSKSGDARKAVGRCSQNPKTLKKLALDREAKVRLAVALNPHADDATIRLLARNEKRPCVTLCRVLARRLKDPVLLEKIIDDCPDMNKGVVRAFQRNAHCPDGLKVFVLLRAQTN